MLSFILSNTYAFAAVFGFILFAAFAVYVATRDL